MSLPHALRGYTKHALGHHTTENTTLSGAIPKLIPATSENVFNFPRIGDHNLGKERTDVNRRDGTTTEGQLREPTAETKAAFHMIVDGKNIADQPLDRSVMGDSPEGFGSEKSEQRPSGEEHGGTACHGSWPVEL